MGFRRSMLRACVLGLALVELGAAAVAKDDGLHLIVGEIRRSERLVRAALATNDEAELHRQTITLSEIASRIRRDTGFEDGRRVCVFAASTLINIILDVRLPPARAVVAMEDDEKEFQRLMTKCDRAVRTARR